MFSVENFKLTFKLTDDKNFISMFKYIESLLKVIINIEIEKSISSKSPKGMFSFTERNSVD